MPYYASNSPSDLVSAFNVVTNSGIWKSDGSWSTDHIAYFNEKSANLSLIFNKNLPFVRNPKRHPKHHTYRWCLENKQGQFESLAVAHLYKQSFSIVYLTTLHLNPKTETALHTLITSLFVGSGCDIVNLYVTDSKSDAGCFANFDKISLWSPNRYWYLGRSAGSNFDVRVISREDWLELDDSKEDIEQLKSLTGKKKTIEKSLYGAPHKKKRNLLSRLFLWK